MEIILNIATGILIPIVLAVASWLSKLSREVTELRVHVAEQYVSKSLMRDTFDPLREDVEFLKSMLLRVAAKLHVGNE